MFNPNNFDISSNSQLNQDLWVLYETNFKRKGFFVDFGSTDGKEINNTYLLEKNYDWTGIVCEPNPFYHENLKLNRNCNIDFKCVYSRSNANLKFLCVNNAEDLSTIGQYASLDEHASKRRNSEVLNVSTISLLDLLDKYNAPKEIDYLSIDTEGSEYDILNAFDFDKYNFKLITVEHNYTHYREEIYKLLSSKGYSRVYMNYSQWDDWYIKT